MLNRRSLRIKAMQTIYAFKQSKESDYYLALDLIKQTFVPDLNSMEFQDKALLDQYRDQGMALFEEFYQSDAIKVGEDVSVEVENTVTDALAYYKKQVNKDLEFFKKRMLSETEKIYDHYLYLLLLPLEWAELAKIEAERTPREGKAMPVGALNLTQNKIIGRLMDSKSLKIEAIKRNLDWTEEREHVRQWFKDILKKDERYQQYLKIEAPSFEEDKQLLLYLVKSIVFKNETIKIFWEERDLNWTENRTILKSMVAKTIKAIAEEGLEAEPELLTLSSNWEDDREFFVQLFGNCIKHDEQYEALISKKTKNWKIERLAAIDKVILEMALCEMINFPSIPVKVTINEYIDISKIYSTPKSKQFINGILDVLSNELQEEGVIKKSGRGLIDNK